jgi:Cu2+-containing amine oxidase
VLAHTTALVTKGFRGIAACVLPGHHPLDPLTEDEVKVAAESCRQHAASLGLPPLRFNTITLQVQSVLFATVLQAANLNYSALLHCHNSRISHRQCMLAVQVLSTKLHQAPVQAASFAKSG